MDTVSLQRKVPIFGGYFSFGRKCKMGNFFDPPFISTMGKLFRDTSISEIRIPTNPTNQPLSECEDLDHDRNAMSSIATNLAKKLRRGPDFSRNAHIIP